MQEQASHYKKISVDLQSHDVIIQLNTSNYPTTLDINCRERNKERKYWASFKITDFDKHIQALFQKIQNLFEYIGQNTEQIQIQKNKFKLKLTYLKQAKEITLTLNKMIMCSAQEQNKLKQKIYNLQIQNSNLKNKVMENQGQGMHKLTYQFSSETLNIISYEFTNFCQIRSKNGHFIYNLLKNSPKTVLPPSGTYYFHVLITDILATHDIAHTSTLQIGIKGSQNQKQIIVLTSLSNSYMMNDEQKLDYTDNFFVRGDFFTIKINVDLKQMIFQKNFRIFKRLNWKSLGSKYVWPHIRLLKLEIKTDLFIDSQEQKWGLVENVRKDDD